MLTAMVSVLRMSFAFMAAVLQACSKIAKGGQHVRDNKFSMVPVHSCIVGIIQKTVVK